MKSTLGIKKECNCVVLCLFLIPALSPSHLTALDSGKTINQYVHNTWVRQKGLPAHSINVAIQTRNGYLWLGTSSGLFKFDGAGFTEVGTNPDNENSHETITTLCETQDGSLRIGTADSFVKIQNGPVKHFATEDNLAGNRASSFFDDHQGSIWIGSPRGDLTRCRNGKFTANNPKAGLFTDEIYSVLSDDKGNIWLSSPSGIRFIQRQELGDYADGKTGSVQTRVYTIADGLKSEECFGWWQPAGWKANNGNLWFATKKGAVLIDVTPFNQNRIPPPVLLEKIIGDEHTIPLDLSITLQPGTEKLEFHYTALRFLVPERVLFKYALEGYDRNWVDAKRSGMIKDIGIIWNSTFKSIRKRNFRIAFAPSVW